MGAGANMAQAQGASPNDASQPYDLLDGRLGGYKGMIGDAVVNV